MLKFFYKFVIYFFVYIQFAIVYLYFQNLSFVN